MATFQTAAAPNPNPNKSFEVTQPSSDSVSSLSFSPKANYLVASFWDNLVVHPRLRYLMTNRYCALPRKMMTVFSEGCDKQAKMWPLSGGQLMTAAMHDAHIKEIAWIPGMNLLVTGSWDKTLKEKVGRFLVCEFDGCGRVAVTERNSKPLNVEDELA